MVDINYKSKIYYVGAVFTTDKCGDFEILGRSIKGKGREYVIRFIDTKYIRTVRIEHIKRGSVKDHYIPLIYGVGYYGVGIKRTAQEYGLWYDMIKRCYSDRELSRRPSYKKVCVCSRWYNFQNFCDDIKTIGGYNEWVNGSNYCLDKDILQKDVEFKIYSKETCVFITQSENVSERNKRITDRKFIATRLSDGYSEIAYNKTEFMEKYNLVSHGCIRDCLNGIYRQYKGWSFKYVTKEVYDG